MSDFASLLKKASNVHKETKSENFKKSSNVLVKKSSISFNEEQKKFLSCNDDKIILSALAGTGKTTLLLHYAKNRPEKKWNLVVFNKQLAEDLKIITPKNVKVNTLHKVAFSRFGHDIHHKLKDSLTLNDFDIINEFKFVEKLNEKTKHNLFKSLSEGFNYFLNSSLPSPSFICCPSKRWKVLINGYDKFNDENLWEEMIKKIWQLSLSSKSAFPITHDVYLKRFTMTDNPWGEGRWILDEAQDWNDAVLSSIRNAPYFIQAGDPFQSLYQWRGASANYHQQKKVKEFWLTNSYRTGQGVEDWVNYRLSNLSCPKTWIPASHAMDVIEDRQTVFNIKKFNPSVVLSYKWEELINLAHLLEKENIAYHFPSSAPVKMDRKTSSSILLSTIHSAKGLEFDRVWILDEALSDFNTFKIKNILAYVALTRAKKSIRIPSSWPKAHSNNLLSAF